jgi:hypothetical protein
VRIFKDKANFREISESYNLMMNKGEIDSSFSGWNIPKIELHNDKNNYVRQQREKYKRKVKLDVRKSAVISCTSVDISYIRADSHIDFIIVCAKP